MNSERADIKLLCSTGSNNASNNKNSSSTTAKTTTPVTTTTAISTSTSSSSNNNRETTTSTLRPRRGRSGGGERRSSSDPFGCNQTSQSLSKTVTDHLKSRGSITVPYSGITISRGLASGYLRPSVVNLYGDYETEEGLGGLVKRSNEDNSNEDSICTVKSFKDNCSTGSKSTKCQQPKSSSSSSSSPSLIPIPSSSTTTVTTSSASTSTTTSTTNTVSTMRISRPKLDPDHLISTLRPHRNEVTSSSTAPPPPPPPPPPPLPMVRSIGLPSITMFPVSRKTQTRELFSPEVRSIGLQRDVSAALQAIGINTDIDMDLMNRILDKILAPKASIAIQTEDTVKPVKVRKCRDASVGTEKFSRERFSALPETRSKYTQTDSSWLRAKTIAVSTEDDSPLPVTLQPSSPGETRRTRGIVRIVRDRPYKLNSKNIQTDFSDHHEVQVGVSKFTSIDSEHSGETKTETDESGDATQQQIWYQPCVQQKQQQSAQVSRPRSPQHQIKASTKTASSQTIDTISSNTIHRPATIAADRNKQIQTDPPIQSNPTIIEIPYSGTETRPVSRATSITTDGNYSDCSSKKSTQETQYNKESSYITSQAQLERSLNQNDRMPIFNSGLMESEVERTNQIKSKTPSPSHRQQTRFAQSSIPSFNPNLSPHNQHYQQQHQQQVPILSNDKLMYNQPTAIQNQPGSSKEQLFGESRTNRISIDDNRTADNKGTTDLVPCSQSERLMRDFAQQLQTHSKVTVSINKESQREFSEVSSITTMDRDGKLSRKTQVSTSRKIPVFTGLNRANHLVGEVDDDQASQSTVTQPVITSPTLSKGTFPSTPASPLGKKYLEATLSESSTRPSSALDAHHIQSVSTQEGLDQYRSTSSNLESNNYYQMRSMNETNIGARMPSPEGPLSVNPSLSAPMTRSTTAASKTRVTDPLHIVISEPGQGDDISLPSPPESASSLTSPLQIRYPLSSAKITEAGETAHSQQPPTELIHARNPIISRRNVKPGLVGITWEEASSSTICSEMSTEPYKDPTGTLHRPKAVSVSSETVIASMGKDTKVETRSRASRKYANNAIIEPDIKSETILTDSPPYPVAPSNQNAYPNQSSLHPCTSTSSPSLPTVQTAKPMETLASQPFQQYRNAESVSSPPPPDRKMYEPERNRQRHKSANHETGNSSSVGLIEGIPRKLNHHSLSTTNLFSEPHSIVNSQRSDRIMHYPPAPPSYTTSPDPRDSQSIGLGYFQPSYTETHLPTFRDDMNLRNLRQIGLSNSDSVAAKSQMLITSPQPSVDSGLKVDGSSVDEFGLRSNVESRESVGPNADSRPISRVTLQNPEMDSKMTGHRTLKESRRDETPRVLAQSAQATIMPKDSKEYVNRQSHQQQYQNQQLRQQPQSKSQGETEITTSITKTTIPEETEPDGIGGLKVKRPAMSRLVLEQLLQSGDRGKGASMGNHSGGETGKGSQSNPPLGGDGCTISSSVTLESPYRYQNKMASMKDLTFSQRKSNDNEREGEEESVKGGNVSRMKSATSMDSIPKKRSKSCHSYTFGGSTPGIGSNESNRAGGGGEVVTTSKFERHKSPQDGRGREETTWEYSMECNCVNGVNTSLRTSVKHKRTYLPFACTMYESSV